MCSLVYLFVKFAFGHRLQYVKWAVGGSAVDGPRCAHLAGMAPYAEILIRKIWVEN